MSEVTSHLVALTNVIGHLIHKVVIMTEQVTSLVSQVAANVDADAKVVAAVVALKAEVADLTAKLTVATAAAGMSQEDKDAIVKATADLKASADHVAAA